jgi:hypothetical protein
MRFLRRPAAILGKIQCEDYRLEGDLSRAMVQCIARKQYPDFCRMNSYELFAHCLKQIGDPRGIINCLRPKTYKNKDAPFEVSVLNDEV